jgi:hypothetical protein
MTRVRARIAVAAALLAIAVPGAGLAQAQAAAGSAGGWIIDGDQLQTLYTDDPPLATANFSTQVTDVFESPSGTAGIQPGWTSTRTSHFTRYESCDGATSCTSLADDINDGVTLPPVALYDDEVWSKTPAAEQQDPCGYMQDFTSAAQAYGLRTILAPDQNLAAPGNITNYQGGETQNWQSYLRLGLARCAAATGTETLHVMSQPFEAYWCCNPQGNGQGGVQDFVSFVTQAALQARAVNPDIEITEGISTNPRYSAAADVMYADYMDVRGIADKAWLNIVGTGGYSMAEQFLTDVDNNKATTVESPVLYLHAADALSSIQPTATQVSAFSLATAGSSLLLTGSQAIPGNTIPSTDGEFQFWTGGTSSQTAELQVNYGYCDSGCGSRHLVQTLDVPVTGGQAGTVVPGGAFDIASPISLPSGTWYPYVRVIVHTAGSFNLLYGSAGDATNLAQTVMFPESG